MRRLPATTVFYAGEFWLALAWDVTFTVSAVYFVREVGLNPFQLVLVGTVMELSIFLFEVPTGVVADTYSRRLSLVIGWLVMGAGMVLVGLVPAFAAILAGYAIWGLGYTFTSGADQAWITDEVGVDQVGRVFARGQQFGYAGGLAGIGLGVAVAAWDLGYAVALGGVLAATFGLFAAVTMPEHGFTRRRRSGTFRELRATAGGGLRLIRASPLLVLILGITFFAGASTESFDRLWEAHLIRDVGLPAVGGLDPVVWFGMFGAVTMVLGLVASGLLARRFERAGQARLARLLTVLTVAQAVAVVGFALAGSLVVAAAMLWAYRLTRSLTEPVYRTWLNQQITDSTVRATTISVTSQADAIGQVAGGPGLGALGTAFGIRAALLAGGALLLPALALYGRALRRHPATAALGDIFSAITEKMSPKVPGLRQGLGAEVGVGLDDREGRAVRVAEHGHPAGAGVHRRDHDGAAQFGRAGGGGVAVVDPEVDHPVRRRLGRRLAGHRHHAADLLLTDLPDRVDHVAEVHIARGQAGDVAVERLRHLGVTGGQLEPAERVGLADHVRAGIVPACQHANVAPAGSRYTAIRPYPMMSIGAMITLPPDSSTRWVKASASSVAR